MSRDQVNRILGALNCHDDGRPAPWIPGAAFIEIPWLRGFLLDVFEDLAERPAGVMPTPKDYAAAHRVNYWRESREAEQAGPVVEVAD